MSLPRQVLPGTTYFVTRRCSERRFFLTPSAQVNQVFLFCLAMAARLTGVQMHAICVMSNHFHLLLTDVWGVLPAFMAWANRHSAICLKLLRGRAGPIWDASEKYSAVALVTPLAVYRKLVYTLTNPAKAGVVGTYTEWSGVCVGHDQWGNGPIDTVRPSMYFKPRKEAPPGLVLSVPPALAHWDQQALIASLSAAVARRESAVRPVRTGLRKAVVGGVALSYQQPPDRPQKANPPGKLNPAFSAVTREARRAAARALKDWRKAYREAYEQFKAGVTSVAFPPGTWWMVKFGGARVAPS